MSTRLRSCVCACLSALPIVGAALAQETALPVRRIGIIGGVNSATLAGPSNANTTSAIGGTLGALVVLPQTPNFSYQAEIEFTMKGAKGRADTTASTLTMDYIEIPVLARYEFSRSASVRPFVYGGPAVAYNLVCNVAATGSATNVSVSCEEIELQNGTTFKRVDYGLIAGAGIEFDIMSGRKMTLGARYDHSLTQISDEDTSKHRVLSIIGTIEFPWRQ